MKSGAISIIGMGVIYTLLAVMGTMSLGEFKVSENGALLLQNAQHYLGDFGIIVLSLIIIVACLKRPLV